MLDHGGGRVRCCVNPEHLEPVDNVTNVMRGESFYAQQARLTHCPKGHPYKGDNLMHTKRNGRKCRECDRVRALAYHHANRDKSNAKRARNAKLVRQRREK